MNSHLIPSYKISELKRLNSDIEIIENELQFQRFITNDKKIELEQLKKELRILIKTL